MASKTTDTGAREHGTGGRAAKPPVEEPLTKQLFGEALYTVQQVALALGITAETVRDWIKAGDLIAIRFGQKEYRIAASALLRYKQDREEEAKLEYESRRAQRRAEAELVQRRAQDPLAHWQWTLCPECGKSQVLRPCPGFSKVPRLRSEP